MSLRQGKLLFNFLIKNQNIKLKPIGVFSYRNYVNTNLENVKQLKLQVNQKVNSNTFYYCFIFKDLVFL